MKSYCIKCGKPTNLRLSPDLDIKGIAVCERCSDDVKKALVIDCYEVGFFNSMVKKWRKEQKTLQI
jgi:hypothetical protein